MQDLSEVLGQLRDIHEPAPITWWPPTFAWWMLLLLSIVLIAGLIVYLRKRLRSLKRLASIELKSISRDFDIHKSDERLLKDLSVFLRRVALHDEKKVIAGLTGSDWLKHLDELSQYQTFTANYADLLLTGPYQKDIRFDSNALMKDLQLWVRNLK
ncbi:MAG: DUF4381 domain-containing protein [Gammaproteobacteria bacterium]|nr:DUF4381 domain-containing protein [Gammaproteobacteria bacterium]